MWMLLIVRMVTRVTAPPQLEEEKHMDDDTKTVEDDDAALELEFFARQDRLRQTLCDYIMSDFSARYVWSSTISD